MVWVVIWLTRASIHSLPDASRYWTYSCRCGVHVGVKGLRFISIPRYSEKPLFCQFLH